MKTMKEINQMVKAGLITIKESEGMIVQAGFVKGLKIKKYDRGIFHLESVKGKRYEFTPYQGLYGVN